MKKLFSLALVGFGFAMNALAAEPEVVTLTVEGTPAKTWAVQRDKPLEVSASRASKFRIVPGLVNPSYVSLEPVGAKGFYLRHSDYIIRLNERDKAGGGPFDADATFKMVKLDGDKVRFESGNYPGYFITVKDDGGVLIMKNPAAGQSTFLMKKVE